MSWEAIAKVRKWWNGESLREKNNKEISDLYCVEAGACRNADQLASEVTEHRADILKSKKPLDLDCLMHQERLVVIRAEAEELPVILAGLAQRMASIQKESPDVSVQTFDIRSESLGETNSDRKRELALLMLSTIYRCYLFTKVVERRKAFAMARVSISGLVLLILLWGLLIPLVWGIITVTMPGCCLAAPKYLVPWLGVVASAGTFGSVVSALRRISLITPGSDPSGTGTKISTALLPLTLIPVGGMIFALLHYLTMLAGMSPARIVNTQHIIPVHGTDYAQALVYSFVAGFAERFVPDIIDSINKKAP